MAGGMNSRLLDMPDLPKLVAGPLIETPPVALGEPVRVLLDLEWTDGHREPEAPGWAWEWTQDAVLVSAQTSRGQYYTWVYPRQVTRR